jgi:hypothetical protein
MYPCIGWPLSMDDMVSVSGKCKVFFSLHAVEIELRCSCQITKQKACLRPGELRISPCPPCEGVEGCR